eukprot:6480162-Amphidinium_carterae.1
MALAIKVNAVLSDASPEADAVKLASLMENSNQILYSGKWGCIEHCRLWEYLAAFILCGWAARRDSLFTLQGSKAVKSSSHATFAHVEVALAILGVQKERVVELQAGCEHNEQQKKAEHLRSGATASRLSLRTSSLPALPLAR